jgi:hypothetical protein
LSPNIKNVCEVICGGVSRSFEIYCHYSDIFDPHLESVVLMLSSEGRTNNTSLERRKEWSYENKVNGKTYTADLKNFNWGNNGWIYDEKN